MDQAKQSNHQARTITAARLPFVDSGQRGASRRFWVVAPSGDARVDEARGAALADAALTQARETGLVPAIYWPILEMLGELECPTRADRALIIGYLDRIATAAAAAPARRGEGGVGNFSSVFGDRGGQLLARGRRFR